MKVEGKENEEDEEWLKGIDERWDWKDISYGEVGNTGEVEGNRLMEGKGKELKKEVN